MSIWRNDKRSYEDTVCSSYRLTRSRRNHWPGFVQQITGTPAGATRWGRCSDRRARRKESSTATPTSAKSTSTPVGRRMRRLSATASPVLMTPIKYAQGRTIKHTLGYDIHIETPMDFMRYPCGAFFCGADLGTRLLPRAPNRLERPVAKRHNPARPAD